MLSRVFSGTTVGLDGELIEVEVDVAGKGFPSFTIVGLPSKSIDEAKDRVRTAIVNAGFEMPDSRLTVNLAPADSPKEGSSLDLPIAIGILTACGSIAREKLHISLFVGELSLEGKLRRVPGVISISLLAKKLKLKEIYVPYANGKEASLVEGITVFPVKNLSELILHLNGVKDLLPQPKLKWIDVAYEDNYEFDFANIKGQAQAKRTLEIAYVYSEVY